MDGIYLLLGSNIEDRLTNLNEAVRLLIDQGISIVKYSPIYETAPWGILDQNWFLNLAIQVQTDLAPVHLLKSCQEVENQMGRKRKEKWGPRIIDVDILYFKYQKIDTEGLIVPHPGIPDRRFTLILLNDLIPNHNHPTLNKSHAQLLAECKDNSVCLKSNYQLSLDLD